MTRIRKTASRRRFASALALLGLFGPALLAMTARADSMLGVPMAFDSIDREDGLTQAVVTRVFQDSHGFLWIGTESGLNRFDGTRFEHFVHERGNPSALVNDYVWDIDEDAAGRLWVATDGGGVAVLDPVTAEFSHYRHADRADALASDAIRSLDVDKDGQIWVGTRGGGLNRIDPASGAVQRFDHPNPAISVPPTATVFDITEARDGTLWFATSAGLYELPPRASAMRRYRHEPGNPNSLSDDTVITVCETEDGVIWAGTYEGGLNRLDLEHSRVTRYRAAPGDSAALSGDYVRDILEDDDGRLWVATASGLNLMDRTLGTFEHYLHESANAYSLPSSYVMSLFQDRGGVLWVGTRGGGLASWNPQSWQFGLTRLAPLNDSLIAAFAAEGDARVWIGSMGAGLQRYDRASGALEDAAAVFGEALASQRTMSLLLDRQRRLWVGTMARGVQAVELDTGRVRSWRHSPDDAASLSSNGIMSILQHSSGDIWVGTFGGGINRIDASSGAVQRISGANGVLATLAGARVTAMAEDGRGALWIATDGLGLFAYQPDDGSARQWVMDESDASTLSANRLYALYIDPDRDELWIGTAGRGLDRLALGAAANGNAVFVNRSIADGLSDNVIYGIEPDASGALWLSSNNGLMRFDPQQDTAVTYHTRHGLQGEEFNFGAHHRGPDGTLYFGGSDGFNVFDPAAVAVGDPSPGVVLTELTVGNRPLAPAVALPAIRTLTLTHDQDAISFQVAVPDYVDAAKNRIAYRLDGFDRDWVQPGLARRFTYTNLDPGSYTLRVRAISSIGAIGEAQLTLALRVLPAPWATWWAKALYVLLGLATVALATRWYRDRIARNAMIKRLAHSDPLTGVANRARFMQRVNEALGALDETSDSLAVLAVDFDHVRRINDSLGIDVADRSLQALANRLLHTVDKRCGDMATLEVARLDGDEFAVLLAGPDAARAATGLGEHLVGAIAETSIDDHQRMGLSTSVGVAHHPLHGDNADTLVKNAQAAAHAARAGGGGASLEYSADIEQRLRQRLSLEQALRLALDRDEFCLYLQPKFSAESQILIGAEALIRWQRPGHGLVAPGRFISVAEEAGIIPAIGHWVVDAAANQLARWRDDGQPVVPIAVNLSGVEVRSGDPAGTIRAAAQRAGIDASLLHVELTESVVMHDVTRTRALLDALRDMGCGLSVDDFGTGYSSLAYLKRFPLDTIKIDRAFITDVDRGDEDRSICAAVIAMAHSLGLSVIAEGVEREPQLQTLIDLGCDQIQGYLLGRPVAAERFAVLFAARAAVDGESRPLPFVSRH